MDVVDIEPATPLEVEFMLRGMKEILWFTSEWTLIRAARVTSPTHNLTLRLACISIRLCVAGALLDRDPTIDADEGRERGQGAQDDAHLHRNIWRAPFRTKRRRMPSERGRRRRAENTL